MTWRQAAAAPSPWQVSSCWTWGPSCCSVAGTTAESEAGNAHRCCRTAVHPGHHPWQLRLSGHTAGAVPVLSVFWEARGLVMLQIAMDPETTRLVRVIVFGVVATALVTGILVWISGPK